MTVARHAGKRGLLRSRAAKLPLGFIHHYATTPFPPPSYPIDVTYGVTDWGMLGNGPDPDCTICPDGCGDCTFAGRQHYRMAKAARGQETETFETANQVVEAYLEYDHGIDEGADIPSLLLYWFRVGKILGFAPVDHTDAAQVDSAMTAFTGVYCGVSLTPDADELFVEQKPWTVAGGQRPDPNDGHCIVKVGASGELDTWVTWGAVQQSTTAWSAACVDEAWVIITEEDAHDQLIDLAALRADISALGGSGS